MLSTECGAKTVGSWQGAIGSRRASAERRNKDLEGAAATFSLITEWVRFVNFLRTTQVKESAERRK